ncbi:sulfhydryl oxidase 1-like [Aricia agestis]|uniref:sulfhydryl oxidase 1-like n=1 Tax=Aricia agestis TaxID=91739 RepID=UPI001C2091A4|nr:sulfhydryl oxidase 1-like [Aricia agestis]
MNWHLFVLKIGYFIAVVNSAVIPDSEDVKDQGLYTDTDHVTILTVKNFEKKVYGQPQAIIVQFYNSYCGHCRAFAPKFKSLALEIESWKNIVKLAVIDCSVEENNAICRDYEVMAYPSLRYLHERYVKGNGNVGEKISAIDTAENLKIEIIKKIQHEQRIGRLRMSQPLNIAAYATIDAVLSNVPVNTMYTFLMFESENSTLGSELTLDVNDYKNVSVVRVYNDSELAKQFGINNVGLVAVKRNHETLKFGISDTNPTVQNLLKSLNAYLLNNRYVFPIRNTDFNDFSNHNNNDNTHSKQDLDAVYYSDLEKTIKTSLHTEITRHKILTGEPLGVLEDYIDVLITAFPFKHNNLKVFLTQLNASLKSKNQWTGAEIYDLVKALENSMAVYSSDLDYVGCKGSQPQYRGYTCGLWTLFHTLTVNSYQKEENLGPKVLKTMLGYVKHFFGCTECSEHFQAMAEKNRLLDVQGNDKAILWLWIAHNEVNLRLAGDVTEDPQHPKIQFPSAKNCPECRLARGAWNLKAVFQYLTRMYDGSYIQMGRTARSADTTNSPFSNLDIGMLSLL